MNSNLFYIISVGVTLLVVVINLLYLYKTSKEIKRRSENLLNHAKVELSYQREQLEDELYHVSDKLTSDPDVYKDVNHLMLTSNDNALVLKQNIADYTFFEGMGFDFTKLKIESKQVMCLMPFHKRYIQVYDAIRNACKKCDYVAIRSDNEFVAGDILKYTIELILKSQIIVAVIDGRNPNVFYEIGIAQSLGKLVILVSKNSEFQNVPFDIRNNRMVLYQTEKELEINLIKCFKTIKGE